MRLTINIEPEDWHAVLASGGIGGTFLDAIRSAPPHVKAMIRHAIDDIEPACKIVPMSKQKSKRATVKPSAKPRQ
jgi:hypothetical protein